MSVIAEIIKEMGILCIGIVTMPFIFEGGKRHRTAKEGLAKIKDKLDALIVIENDRLLTPKIMKIILGKSQCAGAPCSFMENCKYIDDARTNTKIELLE